MGKMQRDKGKAGEREVVHILKDHGFEDARRTQQFSGKEGTADVEGVEGLHIEVKRQETYRIRDWLLQASTDAREGEIPVVVFRASREDWKIVMDFEDFLDLMHPEPPVKREKADGSVDKECCMSSRPHYSKERGER